MVNYLNEEVIQQPEQVREKLILKPKLGESDTGTSHFCFPLFVANKTDADMLFSQICQYTQSCILWHVTLSNGPNG